MMFCSSFNLLLQVLYSSTKKNNSEQCKSRYIPSAAVRVLDAPDLANDFCGFLN